MSAKAHNFRIGLFVLVGAGLFIGALFAMGLKAYFGERDLSKPMSPAKWKTSRWARWSSCAG